MLVSRRKSDGKIIEAAFPSIEKTLIDNAISSGYEKDEIEVVELTNSEVSELIKAQDEKLLTYDKLRAREYPSTDEMVVALWEAIVEDRPEARIALQTKREAVKLKYPKDN